MRVVLVGDYPPPFGGVAIHVQQVHQLLRHAGIEARVLDIGKEARPAPDVLPTRSAAQLIRQVAKHSSSGTVVHLHTSGNNPKSWLVAAAVGSVARPLGSRCVITLHSGLLPSFLAAHRSRQRFARVALGAYDAIVAVSPAVQAALVEAGIPKRKIRCCPAFCASEVKAGAPPERFAEVRARRSTLLAMAHHPSPVYGRRLMFEALARLAEHRPGLGLAVFGPGTKEEAFAADAKATGVEGLLEDFGNLEHDQALALIAGSDAFVRPTTADGDAISVREALALGVACVASDAAVRPRGTYLFRTGDAPSLEAALSEALRDGPRPAETLDAGPVLLSLYRELTSAQPAGTSQRLSNAV